MNEIAFLFVAPSTIIQSRPRSLTIEYLRSQFHMALQKGELWKQ